VDDVVIYSVRLREMESREEWTFKTRYSQLRNKTALPQEKDIQNYQRQSRRHRKEAQGAGEVFQLGVQQQVGSAERRLHLLHRAVSEARPGEGGEVAKAMMVIY
jgi:hypothetical protein